MNGQNAQYMVCRCIKVAYGYMLNLDVQNPEEVTFHVPYMQEGVKAFTDLTDALAYRDEMNEELHHPKKNADGSISIDILSPPATDYVVIDLENRKTINDKEE